MWWCVHCKNYGESEYLFILFVTLFLVKRIWNYDEKIILFACVASVHLHDGRSQYYGGEERFFDDAYWHLPHH